MVREETLSLSLSTWPKLLRFTEQQCSHFKLDIKKEPNVAKLIDKLKNTSNAMDLLNVFFNERS